MAADTALTRRLPVHLCLVLVGLPCPVLVDLRCLALVALRRPTLQAIPASITNITNTASSRLLSPLRQGHLEVVTQARQVLQVVAIQARRDLLAVATQTRQVRLQEGICPLEDHLLAGTPARLGRRPFLRVQVPRLRFLLAHLTSINLRRKGHIKPHHSMRHMRRPVSCDSVHGVAEC